MDRKRILLLTDWYEPGYKAGGPIQSTKNFVAAMLDHYDISVLTSDTDLGEDKPYADVYSNQWIEKQPGLRVYYAELISLNIRQLYHLIRSQSPDFIYLNSMYSRLFSMLPVFLLWKKRIKVPIILSPRGMLRESAIRIKSSRKQAYIRLLNMLHLPEKITFHATDPQEEQDIRRYFPKAKSISLIPNFSAALPEQFVPVKKLAGELQFVYISRIMGIKNIQFILQVLKKIPESIKVGLAIHGDIEDADYWKQTQELMKTLPAQVRAEYKGPLPHSEVIPTIEAYQVFVLPTKGENFGHAIYEAMSAGRPVMISDKTPWRNLKEKKAGWDLPLEDEEAWLSVLIEAVGFDQRTFDEWCNGSRAFVKRHVESSDLKKKYLELFS